jgi:peptidyl-prolyl cis-trans isomerase SurA
MSSTATRGARPAPVGNRINTHSLVAAGLLPIALLAVAGCNRTHSADVVATVNGHAIMRVDMDRMYQQQLGQAQNQPTSPEEADLLKLSSVRELIDEEIVEQTAAKMNLAATPEEVDAKIAEMKAPFPTEEQFEAQLKASNRTLDIVKRDVRRSLTIGKLINKEINSKVTVTDADVTSYYNIHKAEFDLIEPQYHLAEMLVTDVPSAQPGNLQGSKATTDADAKKKIQALKNRLDSGEDFGSLAMNFSENPETAPNGGDKGFIAESQLKSDPSVYAAIAKLKAGQITDIMPLLDGQTKKQVGYVIYKLLSLEPAGQRELNDPRVQQAIREQLRAARSQLIKNAYFEILRDQAKVENFYAEEIFKNNAK